MKIRRGREVLLGLAIGDALGSPNEFSQYPHTLETYDTDNPTEFAEGSPFGFRAGEVTDDTQMTLIGLRATKESISAGDLGDSPNYLAHAKRLFHAYSQWAESSPPDIGRQTQVGLDHFGASVDYARHFPDACGNGGLMRAAAPYLAGLRGEPLYVATALDTVITHANPYALMVSVAFAMLLDYGAEGLSLEAALERTVATLQEQCTSQKPQLLEEIYCVLDAAGYGETRLAEEYGKPAAADIADCLQNMLDDSRAPLPPTGYAVSTLQNALYHNIVADSVDRRYMQAVMYAVNFGGDADTSPASQAR